MSRVIQQDLQASGVALVVFVLKDAPATAAASTTARDVSKYCVSSELSQESALVSAATARAATGAAPPPPRRGRARRQAEETIRAATDLKRRPAVLETPIPEAEPPPLVRYYPNLGVCLGTVTKAGLAAARKDSQIENVLGAPRLELIRPTRVRAAALRARLTWGLRRMRVPDLWKQGLTGEGVLVGHLDTGVDGEHPALREAFGAFAEFDSFGRQVVPDPAPHDSEDHGTHTAATILGRPLGDRHIGVAPGAKLASALVIEGGQVVARVLGGMDWTLARGARILSMSLGLSGYWEDFLPITQILRQRGVLPVMAVGNEGPGTSRSPGNYIEALSVGAFDREGDVAQFSSSQRFARPNDAVVPDVVAPGVGVISARPGGGFQTMQGSSMATPHVAGLAALLLQAKPDATVDELEHAIFASCTLEPSWPPERAGRGRPDGPRALEILTA
jgi:subtilisin family serine protease